MQNQPTPPPLGRSMRAERLDQKKKNNHEGYLFFVGGHIIKCFDATHQYTLTLRLVNKLPDLRARCANLFLWLCHRARSSQS